MLGFSTAWLSQTVNTGDELLQRLHELGVVFLELEYRLTEKLFSDIKPRLRVKNFKVLSIHNFFPFPSEYSHLKPSGDLFLLSSVDQEERKKAVQFTVKTMQTAHDLECPAVVLHLGKIDMESYHEQFCRYFDSKLVDSPEMGSFISGVKSERKHKQKKFLDAVLFSLDTLAREAEKLNVRLGIENRYYFHEIPDFEETGIILQKFAGSTIGYWHDIGHGHVQDRLGMQSHREILEAYQEYLFGCHLHDANGYNDHKAPGKGEIDFSWFRKYLKDETLRVLEVNPRTSFEEIKEGFAFLKDVGIE
jgi:sugar phosphate isomerase/epimerase